MPSWTDGAAAFPVIGVGLTWLMSFVTHRWLIGCGNGAFTCRHSAALDKLRAAFFGMDLKADPVLQQASDVAARLAWHPTAVAFGVVAVSTILACGYLVVASLRDTFGPAEARFWTPVVAAVPAIVALITSFTAPDWILRSDVLTPLLSRALGNASPFAGVPATLHRGYLVLAFTASVCVVAAAATALLIPHNLPAGPGRARAMTRHLAAQWRRLSLTLYAGAALLATAVVHQSSVYAWGAAFANATKDTRKAAIDARVDSLDIVNAKLALVKIRLQRDSSAAVKADSSRLQGQSDSLSQAIVVDTLSTAAGARRADALMKHVAGLSDAAIVRGGALVYSILLALMYLPGALILMERSRELSEVEVNGPDDTAATRATWRTNHGIEFSFSTQWSKVFAVSSPFLASTTFAYLFSLFG